MAPTLTRPELNAVYQAKFGYTADDFAEMERIKAGTYFLVRNDGPAGERFRCGRCNALHAYFTTGCVELPYSGLYEALYAYTAVAKYRDERATRILSFLPDIASRHPDLARAWEIKDGFGEAMYGVALGLAEPISEAEARTYCLRISLRGYRPPFIFR